MDSPKDKPVEGYPSGRRIAEKRLLVVSNLLLQQGNHENHNAMCSSAVCNQVLHEVKGMQVNPKLGPNNKYGEQLCQLKLLLSPIRTQCT